MHNCIRNVVEVQLYCKPNNNKKNLNGMHALWAKLRRGKNRFEILKCDLDEARVKSTTGEWMQEMETKKFNKIDWWLTSSRDLDEKYLKHVSKKLRLKLKVHELKSELRNSWNKNLH